MRKVFVVEFDEEDLGKDWMNIYNMELCLYSKEHTNRDLLTITEVEEIADKNNVAYYSNV